MARYFFHVRNDQVLFEDKRGGEFTDLLAAWNWAMDDVRKMVNEGQLAGSVDNQWVEICDIAGTAVASLPFVRVVQQLN